MRNQEIAKILNELAVLLEMEGVAFKPRAYERVAHTIGGLVEEVSGIYKKGGLEALLDIPGVGQGIAERIGELLKTGKAKDYEKLKKKYPVNIEELSAIEGVGPKMIKALWAKMKIRSIDDLDKAARAGKLHVLPRFGTKLEQKILKGIEFQKRTSGRFLLGEIRPLVRDIEARLSSLKEVQKLIICGSYRRWQETVGDIDILATSERPERVMKYFTAMSEVVHVYGTGRTKSMVRLRLGIDADLRVVPPAAFGAAVQYFTGDKSHNIKVREIAIKKGYKLNEYGLFSAKGGKGRKLVAAETEEEIYAKLGMQWIPPEMRTDTGEIEAALSGKLPQVIDYGELRGDLQTTTNWTDGSNSIEEMADAATKLGLEYIAITDHTQSLAMTGGADEKKLLRQMGEIDNINFKLKTKNLKLRVLKGAEVNIIKEGLLDIDDAVLAKLDVVGVAVHSHFTLPRNEQTRRVLRAMENPHADILFHPTGRILGKRAPIDIDMDAIIAAAKRTGTVLEIDADPWRLDLKDEYIRKAVAAGVKLAIDSDAHATPHLKNLEYGIAQARRGWATKRDVINAWPLEKMLSQLKQSK